MLSQDTIIKSIYALLSQYVDIPVRETEARQTDDVPPFCVFNLIDTAPENTICAENYSIRLQISFFGYRENGVEDLRSYSDYLYQNLTAQNVFIIDGSDNKFGLIKPVSKERRINTRDLIQIIQEFEIKI